MKNDNSNLIEKMKEIDFSVESKNKDKILDDLQLKLKNMDTEKGDINMNKKIRKPLTLMVASISLILCFSIVAYGDDLWRVIQEISIGSHASFMQIETEEIAVTPEITESDKVKIEKTNKAEQKEIEDMTAYYTDLEEANEFFAYDYLNPAYLPEGYSFANAALYKNENGVVEKGIKYLTINYKSGEKTIITMLRYMDEETAFGFVSDKEIEEITINGHKAVAVGNGVDIEIDSIMYSIFGNDEVPRAELIKIAESLK